MMCPALTFGLLLLTAPAIRAQAPAVQPSPKEKFEDFARRAEATLDSRPEESARWYKEALAIRPDWAEGWLYLGSALFQLNRFAEASDALRKGLALAPNIATGWALLGLTESQLEDQDQALADIRKGETLGLNEHHAFEVAVRARAAQILVKSSAFDEAIAQLQPLAGHQEDSRALEEAMGLGVLSIPEDVSQISPERRAIVDLAGKAAWALANRRLEDAAASYRELVERYSKEPGVHYAYGLYLMESDSNAALAEFQKEIQANPKHWPALLFSASLQIRQGNPESAIQTLQQALKAAPAKYRWICHADLGRANMAQNNLDAAITQLEAAVRQKPSNANVHFLLSQAYRRAGRKADAEREQAEFEKTKVVQDPLAVPAFQQFGFSDKN